MLNDSTNDYLTETLVSEKNTAIEPLKLSSPKHNFFYAKKNSLESEEKIQEKMALNPDKNVDLSENINEKEKDDYVNFEETFANLKFSSSKVLSSKSSKGVYSMDDDVLRLYSEKANKKFMLGSAFKLLFKISVIYMNVIGPVFGYRKKITESAKESKKHDKNYAKRQSSIENSVTTPFKNYNKSFYN